ncbi:conserved hypothetical protein [Vibrio chagasii]|nr:conserved hypothetical protein [Vibrio chagasii]CAH7054355.1 conserved hypothetical protein [Vibrio chagasii]CAH7064494.1 conserved hypothetical protein [Vibrio chagasii]CAH7362057.1 conserved hypothetical protein [Vibrio chagasii]CAH7378006.1 conserved hypothetical protein [Vibrio chagasii]
MYSCAQNLTKSTLSKLKSTLLRYFCYRELILYRFENNDSYYYNQLKNSGFELLKAENISACKFLYESDEKKIVISELQKGSIVYLLHEKNTVSAYACLASSKINIGEISAKIEVLDDEVYIYNCFTMPNCRGKGLYTKLLNVIVSDNIDNSIFIASLKSNKKSISVIEKNNFCFFDKVRFVRLFGIKRMFFNFQRKIE